MSGYVIPYCPAPMPDELLSSWIERIGLFYGVSLSSTMAALLPGKGPGAWETSDDIDADISLREALIAWTGVCADRVPSVLPADSCCHVERPARLAYCPRCWDEDVLEGGMPYVRASWTRWLIVSCSAHGGWLCARRPRTYRESYMTGWAGVWRSNRLWAFATYQRYEPSLLASARAFDPARFARPQPGWKGFHEELSAGIGADAGQATVTQNEICLANVNAWHESLVWNKARAALQTRSPSQRLDECDLVRLKRTEPQWIANRIAGIAIALEVACAHSTHQPLFPRVAALLSRSGRAAHNVGLTKHRAQSHER
jgi:hypothetical protein